MPKSLEGLTLHEARRRLLRVIRAGSLDGWVDTTPLGNLLRQAGSSGLPDMLLPMVSDLLPVWAELSGKTQALTLLSCRPELEGLFRREVGTYSLALPSINQVGRSLGVCILPGLAGTDTSVTARVLVSGLASTLVPPYFNQRRSDAVTKARKGSVVTNVSNYGGLAELDAVLTTTTPGSAYEKS